MILTKCLDLLPSDREFRLNNVGELEQFVGGGWCRKSGVNH